MKLDKIYTSPTNLFKPVEFHPGLNIIYAHKTNEKSQQEDLSLHAVGKSTLIDLILFSLLYDIKFLHRLQNALNKKIITGISSILEFTVDGVQYYIKRSFDEPNKELYFGEINKGKRFPLGKLRDKLFDLIFKRENYPGYINNNWYYKLFDFYIKDRKREDIFIDPLKYSNNISSLEVTPLQLFLLDINNKIPADNMKIVEDIQKLETQQNQQEKIAVQQYEVKDIVTLESKRQGLLNRIKKIEKSIDEFSLVEEYQDYEDKANELTKQIKELWFRKSMYDKKKLEIEEYKKELAEEAKDNIDRIKTLYGEVQYLLADKINLVLDDAIEFRKRLKSSRDEFIDAEEGEIANKLSKLNEKIKKLDTERSGIFLKLSKTKALDDLNDMHGKLSITEKQYAELNSALKQIENTKKEITERNNELETVFEQIDEYLEKIEQAVEKIRVSIESIYRQLALDTHTVDYFEISETKEKQKIKIDLLEGSIIDSTGINQVRTLVYDMAVLLNNVEKKLNAPYFIIHDGIFESLHKGHYYAFVNFIDSLIEKGLNFQYILTLNEKDYLNEIEGFKKEKIIDNAIIQLTPERPLLGKKY